MGLLSQRICRSSLFFFWPRHTACGILVARPGIEPGPWSVKGQSPTHWTTREFPVFIFIKYHQTNFQKGQDEMCISTSPGGKCRFLYIFTNSRYNSFLTFFPQSVGYVVISLCSSNVQNFPGFLLI